MAVAEVPAAEKSPFRHKLQKRRHGVGDVQQVLVAAPVDGSLVAEVIHRFDRRDVSQHVIDFSSDRCKAVDAADVVVIVRPFLRPPAQSFLAPALVEADRSAETEQFFAEYFVYMSALPEPKDVAADPVHKAAELLLFRVAVEPRKILVVAVDEGDREGQRGQFVQFFFGMFVHVASAFFFVLPHAAEVACCDDHIPFRRTVLIIVYMQQELRIEESAELAVQISGEIDCHGKLLLYDEFAPEFIY